MQEESGRPLRCPAIHRTHEQGRSVELLKLPADQAPLSSRTDTPPGCRGRTDILPECVGPIRFTPMRPFEFRISWSVRGPVSPKSAGDCRTMRQTGPQQARLFSEFLAEPGAMAQERHHRQWRLLPRQPIRKMRPITLRPAESSPDPRRPPDAPGASLPAIPPGPSPRSRPRMTADPWATLRRAGSS